MSSKLTSEILDDETLAELIAFRRSRVEYCPKEGLPYQKALHDSMMLALEELQERRKADSEPVATLDVQSGRPDGHKFSLAYSSVAHKLPDDVYFLYRHAQQPAVPEGLRLALSNAGIAAPESDEMLAATQGKYIQQLVSWVRDRKPFQPAPVLKPVGYLFVSDQGVVAYSPTNWGMPDFRLIGQIYGDMNVELQPAQKRAHKWSYGLVHPENCQCIECRSARINGVKP